MNNSRTEPTLSLPTVAMAVLAVAEYIRLPPAGELDPVFGLSRSYINQLILPRQENSFLPEVQSSMLRRPQTKSGVRLVKVASLRKYLASQAEIQGGHQSSGLQPADELGCGGISQKAEFIRLPKVKQRDPVFGLSRSFLNQLILPGPDNHFSPPVRSHLLRRRGCRTGIRLISVDSLRAYIQAHETIPAASA